MKKRANTNRGFDPKKHQAAMEEIRRERIQRESGYRARALKLFPHICASCGREFEGQRLKELTVHHKDHDHTNNPPDGSNWELLCLYCHDHEHEKYLMKGHGDGRGANTSAVSAGFNVFDNLDTLLDVREAGD
ncbi:MAG: HNH nuclease family protein [Spartobacteria bacterium]|nr:HNH nuclease family protein [Spartobacteria bacterium]